MPGNTTVVTAIPNPTPTTSGWGYAISAFGVAAVGGIVGGLALLHKRRGATGNTVELNAHAADIEQGRTPDNIEASMGGQAPNDTAQPVVGPNTARLSSFSNAQGRH
jgi:hypothetical protein